MLPKHVIWSVVILCVAPSLLHLAGVDFGARLPLVTPEDWADLSPALLSDQLHHSLGGSFVHTILEWSAVCAAIFTAVLAFSHFSIKRDVTTPIIGVALLCAGAMDAFHVLAADRLINAVADNQDLVAFTWAICRLGNALLTIVGVSLFLGGRPKRWQSSFPLMAGVSVCFIAVAYVVLHACATSSQLPTTMFPNALIRRPWDVMPLVLFLVAGIFIYPKFYRRYPSIFSSALVLSTVPNAVTQMHMAFGSAELFDNDFNIGHFLKVVAYLVPLVGLVIDYTYTHDQVQRTNERLIQEVEERERAQQTLLASEAQERERSQQLSEALQHLQTTQAQLIQSEKMSSLGQLVAGVAHEINNPVNFIHGNVYHARQYTEDLLSLADLYELHCQTAHPAIADKLEEIDLPFIRKDLPRLLSSMQVGADRIREIVRSLRIFSRLDEAEVKEVDIHEGIDSTLTILQNRLKARTGHPGIAVVREYGNLPAVECYAGQLNQVFMNLLSNAIDALDESINRRSPEALKADPPTIWIRTERGTGDRVVIHISDNGPGLSAIAEERIFNPFFTTKPVGQGTGLGLSISYQIVTETHHGSLRCVSQPGQGADFVIELPLRQHVLA